MSNIKKVLKQKTKVVHEDDLALSKNFGKSIKYRRRLAQEREAQALYEDGIKEVVDNTRDVLDNG